MNKEMLMEILNSVDTEVIKKIASIIRELYMELVESGFTPDQAIDIIKSFDFKK